MSIKHYNVVYGAGELELSVEVNFDKTSIGELTLIASNHLEYQSYLIQSNNNPVIAFIKLLAKTCFKICIQKELNTQGLIEEFDDRRGRGVDLFPAMNGECGIRITYFAFDELDPSLFDCVLTGEN